MYNIIVKKKGADLYSRPRILISGNNHFAFSTFTVYCHYNPFYIVLNLFHSLLQPLFTCFPFSYQTLFLFNNGEKKCRFHREHQSDGEEITLLSAWVALSQEPCAGNGCQVNRRKVHAHIFKSIHKTVSIYLNIENNTTQCQKLPHDIHIFLPFRITF